VRDGHGSTVDKTVTDLTSTQYIVLVPKDGPLVIHSAKINEYVVLVTGPALKQSVSQHLELNSYVNSYG